MQWEEPFDVTVYCVKTDGNNMFMAGTARYGMSRLWDKRTVQPIQVRFKQFFSNVRFCHIYTCE